MTNRSRRELTERKAVEELLRRDPVEARDRVLLDEAQHREATAERERADDDEEERERAEPRARVERERHRDARGEREQQGQCERRRDEDRAPRARRVQHDRDRPGDEQHGDDADLRKRHRDRGHHRERQLPRVLDRGAPEAVHGDREDAEHDRREAVERAAQCRHRGERRVEERERQHHHEPRHDEAHARHEGAHPSRARVAEEHRELRRRRTGQEIREREPFEEPLFAEPAALLLDLRLHHAEDADTAIAHRAEREERRRNLVHGTDLRRDDPGCAAPRQLTIL